MIYCLNTDCQSPKNPKNNKYCQKCGYRLEILRNRYLPVKLLGSGGFGKVYLAKDLDKLNELCVIKKFAPYVQVTEGLQKAKELFVREAQQLQKLGEYPHIPTLYAYFEEKGGLYLIQQYIEGETLEQELKRQGIFNEDKIISLLKELLNILNFVHKQHIIHRDIKPSNIIRRSQVNVEQGSVVLIDLGIAKQVNKTILTTGTTIGSFGYVPIEQMEEGKVYPASDLYSLGVTCFHLASGVDPWSLWKVEGYNWTKDWQNELKQPLGNKLAHIIDKLLQVNYKNRYQSATDVLNDLENASTTIKTKTPISVYSSPRPSPSTRLTSPSSTTIFTKSPSSSPPSVPNQPSPVSSISHNKTFPVSINPQKTSIKPISLALTICTLGLIGTGIILTQIPQIAFLCTKLNNCAKDQQFQVLYTKNSQTLKSLQTTQPTNLDTLEKNRNLLTNTINQLQTIPENTKVFYSAKQSITKYQEEIKKIDQKIAQEKGAEQYLNKAKQQIQRAQNHIQNPDSLNDYQQVKQLWNEVDNTLHLIPENTFIFPEAKNQQQNAQNKIKIIDNHINQITTRQEEQKQLEQATNKISINKKPKQISNHTHPKQKNPKKPLWESPDQSSAHDKLW